MILVNLIEIYIFYLLTFLGLILKKITKYEHEELIKPVKLFLICSNVFFYVFLLYTFRFDYYIIIFLAVFYIFIHSLKLYRLYTIHSALQYAVMFIILRNSDTHLYLLLVPIILLFIEKSMFTITKKNEIISTTIIALAYIFSLFIS